MIPTQLNQQPERHRTSKSKQSIFSRWISSFAKRKENRYTYQRQLLENTGQGVYIYTPYSPHKTGKPQPGGTND